MSASSNMSTPYRTNAQLAEEIPLMPKKSKPFPHWTWKVGTIFVEPIAIGVIFDVYDRFPTHHGLVAGVGVATALAGVAALYCLVEGVP